LWWIEEHCSARDFLAIQSEADGRTAAWRQVFAMAAVPILTAMFADRTQAAATAQKSVAPW
jgi:hypothetical protein